MIDNKTFVGQIPDRDSPDRGRIGDLKRYIAANRRHMLPFTNPRPAPSSSESGDQKAA